MWDWIAVNWRDVISILGLVVSVSGFSIAIWQTPRTRRSAEAAELAVLKTKKNLTIADLIRASERVDAIKRAAPAPPVGVSTREISRSEVDVSRYQGTAASKSF